MKFLVLKEEGIGNAIESIPLLRALRHYFPLAQIDIVCSERNEQVFHLINCINNIIPFYKLKLNNPIELDKYDICLNTVFSTNLFLSKVKDKCKIIIEADNDFKRYSEAELNLTLLEKIGIKIRKRFLAEIDIKKERKKNIICIHAGCFYHKVWNTRKWFIDRWVELISLIPDKYKIYLIGDIFEVPDNYEIYKEANKLCKSTRVKNIAYLTDLYDTAKVISSAKALVSIDSGMVHLACAVKTKSLVLYGPTSEIKSCPMVPKSRYKFLRVPLVCQRCYVENKARWNCCQDNQCMKQITPEMVYNELCKLI